MTGTFEHRVVYVNKAETEALRCSVCGSPPEFEWIDAGVSLTYRVMVPGRLKCPNGPHEMTYDEYRAMDVVTLPAPPRPGRDPGVTECVRRRRWWRK